MTPPDRAPEPLSAEEVLSTLLMSVHVAQERHGNGLLGSTAVASVLADIEHGLRGLRLLDAARDSRPVGEGLTEAIQREGLSGRWTGMTFERIAKYESETLAALLAGSLQAGPAAVQPVESKPPFNSFETGEGIRGYDFDEVNEWWAVRPVERGLDVERGVDLLASLRAVIAERNALRAVLVSASNEVLGIFNEEIAGGAPTSRLVVLSLRDRVLSCLSTTQPASTEAGE